ncbi:phosphohydrolase [marine bacterium AO1-C]|nr:phosphohydrolase [marine bacterium AO1-C]
MKITEINQLRTLYNQPSERALKKQLPSLDKHCIHYISKSPFLVLSTVDKQGKVDASPRGGAPGFVHVIDQQQIIISDAKGNNRLDSLVNIVETGQVGLLFLIPGVDETLRVNGSAYITTEAEVLARFSNEKNPPQTCIVVSVEEAYLHCAKALMRSKLWSEDAQIMRTELPTMGQMLKDQVGGDKAPESQEEMVKRYKKDL